MIKILSGIIIIILIVVTDITGQSQLTKSVISNGGGTSANQEMLVHVSIGQPIIGKTSSDSIIGHLGFWTAGITPSESITLAESRDASGSFTISQNYPNPFSGDTFFDLSLPNASEVELSVYTIDGILIGKPLKRTLNIGTYQISLAGAHFVDGQYLCVFRVGAEKVIKTIVVVR